MQRQKYKEEQEQEQEQDEDDDDERDEEDDDEKEDEDEDEATAETHPVVTYSGLSVLRALHCKDRPIRRRSAADCRQWLTCLICSPCAFPDTKTPSPRRPCHCSQLREAQDQIGPQRPELASRWLASAARAETARRGQSGW